MPVTAMMSRRGPALLALSVLVGAIGPLGGCVTRSTEIAPKPGDAAAYAGWDCDRLRDGMDLVQQQAADVAYAVDARAGNNMIALGLGVTVFWPALLAMRPDGHDAAQLADLKGRFEAMRQVAATQGCAPAGEAMSAQRAATLPVAAGDRLVYEERQGTPGHAQLLAMQVSALRRDRIDFRVDLGGGQVLPLWSQDLAGNTLADGAQPLPRWRHLLRRELTLGQVLSGELAAAGESVPGARVRAQVVAVGPQQLAGRRFDVAVIELFGEAPLSHPSIGAVAGSTRLDGVMAIDRSSGVLLRLDLRSANPDFALRRRLLRIEPATP